MREEERLGEENVQASLASIINFLCTSGRYVL